MTAISSVIDTVLVPIFEADMPVIGIPYGIFVCGCAGVLLLVRLAMKVV